ncbi:Membrane domain of glycerophosphoryl diester phosphodiesterase [Microbacterium sp. cf046]|uniref:glycerophosphoryl diester phosphodiesterase membrane domain-containing protein n=1 Tax=Microbacterium sp. cf046 TaxID=1761803 RepID=UPI0008F36414|nr:glycerophosphoryl diester phosphodiesterase membrane domain-containing protein [Microbacterium sp. cf046]SFR99398.1 Membrane domain of glycerophosphoryl diester phosphodiesterase [Microbacterium sp. cf046]
MTAYPAWTPASRPGIIPLRPLTFGTILGRSFAALRQNPRVLLGFALCVQTAAYILVLLGVGAVAFASFTRLDTLREGTDEFDAVMAGSIALTAITGIVLGLAAGALGVIVQGVVVSEVAHAAVAEKLTLRALWQRVKPVAWRLIGYSFLLALAALLLIGVVAAVIFAIGVAALPAAVALTILAFLAAIPLTLWLSTKLLLAPATIILERATIRTAIGRSWTLIRGRFWPALGVIVIISLVFGTIAQVVSIPFSFLSTIVTTIISPTGDPEPSAIIGIVVTVVLTQIVTLLIQSVAVVVQATATAIIYIDCRVRREGLDIDLLTYVERRDAGAIGLTDPYLENIGRVIAPRPVAYPAPAFAPGAGYPPPYPGQAYAPQPYPGQGYAPQPHPGQAYPTQPHPGQAYPTQPYPGQAYPTQPSAGPQHPAPAAAPYSPAPPPVAPVSPPEPAAPAPADDTPPASTRWAAPGAQGDAIDPESPWS